MIKTTLKLMGVVLALVAPAVQAQSPVTATKPTLFSADESVLMQRSCYRGPFGDYQKWVSLVTKGNEKRAQSFRARFPEPVYQDYQATLDCQWFTYEVDGVTVQGFAIIPRNASADKPLPVVIANRGGNSNRRHTLLFGTLMRSYMPLAKAGFIVIGSQYRGAQVWSKRMKGKIDPGKDEFGGKDVDDVLALLPIVDGMINADSDRIGMMGWSRGGMMTYLAATRSDRIKAIATGAAPTDLAALLKTRPDMENVYKKFIPDYDTAPEKVLKARSVQHWTEKLPSDLPVMLLHGDADIRVPIEQSEQLVEKFKAKAQPYAYFRFPGGNHGLSKDQAAVQRKLAAWFNLYL